MMPDGRPYAQCSTLSIMSCTLIPKLVVGTGCVVQMTVAGRRSGCCLNESLVPLFHCCIQSLTAYSLVAFCHFIEESCFSYHLLSVLGKKYISRHSDTPYLPSETSGNKIKYSGCYGYDSYPWPWIQTITLGLFPHAGIRKQYVCPQLLLCRF